jgi:hypothetical protein
MIEDRCSVSDAFWDEYSKEERTIGYCACLLLEYRQRTVVALLEETESLRKRQVWQRAGPVKV